MIESLCREEVTDHEEIQNSLTRDDLPYHDFMPGIRGGRNNR